MTSDVDLKQCIIALLETAYGSIKQATDDVTDEQLYDQPTVESNSMAWLVWHLSRWRDCITLLCGRNCQALLSAFLSFFIHSTLL